MSGECSTRIWADGCYDLVHFGHANSLRQAKALGDYLIVGVHSDAEIRRHKGPTVYTEEERIRLLRSIRWVDEVVTQLPYTTTVDTLNKYECEFCCHGNDMATTANGEDAYALIKSSGRYKEIERTPGISTTKLLRRILSINVLDGDDDGTAAEQPTEMRQRCSTASPWTGSDLLLSTNFLRQFLPRMVAAASNSTIIYCPGTFDLFHIGHLTLLETVAHTMAAADAQCYIIVGLYSDAAVAQVKGSNYPIMCLQERLLNVLACRLVSNVLIGVSRDISEDLLQQYKVDVVVHGNTTVHDVDEFEARFHVAKVQGKFSIVNTDCTVTTETIVERIHSKRAEFQARNRQKEDKEYRIFTAMRESLQEPEEEGNY